MNTFERVNIINTLTVLTNQLLKCKVLTPQWMIRTPKLVFKVNLMETFEPCHHFANVQAKFTGVYTIVSTVTNY